MEKSRQVDGPGLDMTGTHCGLALDFETDSLILLHDKMHGLRRTIASFFPVCRTALVTCRDVQPATAAPANEVFSSA